MGKINKRETNFAPVNGSKSRLGSRMRKRKIATFFSDPLLVPRINKYLADHKDQVYIDVNDMVGELQAQYREYGRRKRTAFKPLVARAYSCIIDDYDTSRYNKRKQRSENSSSTSSDEETRQPRSRRKTSSNSQLLRLYGARSASRREAEELNSNDSSAELVEASSDENRRLTARDRVIAEEWKHFQSQMTRHTRTAYAAGPPQGPARIRPSMFMPNRPGRDLFSRAYPRIMKRRRTQNGARKVTFADFGGDERVLEEVCKLILHIPHPEIYRQVGVTAPCGVLLHGPPGCGKTLLARAIAGEMDVELVQVSAPELIGGVSGESEERIRDLFERAYRSAPCVLFIDEVDAITPNRELAQKEMERRIVAQLLTCLDELSTKPNGDQVLVIGATNRPESLDPALRRAGRFDREVCLGIPDLRAREKILRVLCSKMNLAENFSYEELAQITPGFVGADLLSLTREAALVAVNRIFGQLEALRNQDQANKRRRLDRDERDTDNDDALESSQSDEPLPPELASNELMLRQAEEAISQNYANEQHSLQTQARARARARAGLIDEEAGEGPSNRMDTDATNEGASVSNRETGGRDEIRTRSKTKAEAEAEAGAEADIEPEPDNDDEDDDSEDEDNDDDDDAEDEIPIVANEAPTLETLISWLHDRTPLTCRQLRDVCITQDDFRRALRSVQPSAKREGFATVPDVNWDDVGSLVDIREELKMSILGPVQFRKQFETLGLRGPAGILICGPPGCGKTLLAKAVANEAGINFISVKGPELLNMYVGESERAVRRCFQRARNSAPCVIFFDELDALCPRRSEGSENGASKRVVNQLLTEMDGVEDRKEVYLMAATNRPDIVDPAVLRPGRLDKVIYVGLPEPEDRVDILRAVTKNGTRPRLNPNVNLEDIARRPECAGYSGADLAALVREAGIQAVKGYMAMPQEDIEDNISVGMEHFERALQKIRPSVSPEDRVYYENMRIKYQARRPK